MKGMNYHVEVFNLILALFLNKRFDRLLYSFCRHIPTILIVCPTSVKHKWIHDFDDDFFLSFVLLIAF